MKGDILARTEWLFLSEITVILFVGIFVGSLFWIYRPGSRERYAARAQMPLNDGEALEGVGPSARS
jgi:cbb3-type cytochrome oxidase subunit 3